MAHLVPITHTFIIDAAELWKDDEPIKALDKLTEGICYLPNAAALFVVRGMFYEDLNLVFAALQDFTTASVSNSRLYDAHYGMGRCLQKLGKLEEAIASYGKFNQESTILFKDILPTARLEALRLMLLLAPEGFSSDEFNILRAQVNQGTDQLHRLVQYHFLRAQGLEYEIEAFNILDDIINELPSPAQSPIGREARLWRAHEFIVQNKIREAWQDVDIVLTEISNDPVALLIRSAAYFRMGMVKEGENDHSKANTIRSVDRTGSPTLGPRYGLESMAELACLVYRNWIEFDTKLDPCGYVDVEKNPFLISAFCMEAAYAYTHEGPRQAIELLSRAEYFRDDPPFNDILIMLDGNEDSQLSAIGALRRLIDQHPPYLSGVWCELMTPVSHILQTSTMSAQA